MQDQLAQLLKFLTETLAQGKDFTIEQAPLFVRELLMWRFYEALIYMVAWTVVFAVLAWCLPTIITSAASLNNTRAGICKRWVYGMTAILLTFSLAINALMMVKVKVAPRVVVVELVRELITPAPSSR